MFSINNHIIVLTAYMYLSVKVEVAEDHKNSTDFGEQRSEDESKTENQKIRTALEIHQLISRLIIFRNQNINVTEGSATAESHG